MNYVDKVLYKVKISPNNLLPYLLCLTVHVIKKLTFNRHTTGTGTDSLHGCLYEHSNVYCGLPCGGMLVSSVLFANDTVLLAESAEDMKRSLQCLQPWCEEWSVELNGEKSALMHMKNRRVDRCAATFKMSL